MRASFLFLCFFSFHFSLSVRAELFPDLELPSMVVRVLDHNRPLGERSQALRKLQAISSWASAVLARGEPTEEYLNARNARAFISNALFDRNRTGAILDLAEVAARNGTAHEPTAENQFIAAALEFVAPFAERQDHPVDATLAAVLRSFQAPVALDSPLAIAVFRLIDNDQLSIRGPELAREAVRVWRAGIFGNRSDEWFGLFTGPLREHMTPENWREVAKAVEGPNRLNVLALFSEHFLPSEEIPKAIVALLDQPNPMGISDPRESLPANSPFRNVLEAMRRASPRHYREASGRDLQSALLINSLITDHRTQDSVVLAKMDAAIASHPGVSLLLQALALGGFSRVRRRLLNLRVKNCALGILEFLGVR